MEKGKIQRISVEDSDEGFFDQLGSEYDQMMDWESRLQKETPFFKRILADNQVRSVLDLGCGTGRHCFHFLTLGVESVMGADHSSGMIELALARAAASGGGIRFIQASFTEAADQIKESFDMVCILGNSISNVLKYDDLVLSLNNCERLLSRQGITLLQCINWDLRLQQKNRFFPPVNHPSTEGQKIFFRFFDYEDELVKMNLIIFQQGGPPNWTWTHRILSTPLRPWKREVLKMALDDAGLTLKKEFGGTDLSSFRQEKSPDYICIACRK